MLTLKYLENVYVQMVFGGANAKNPHIKLYDRNPQSSVQGTFIFNRGLNAHAANTVSTKRDGKHNE